MTELFAEHKDELADEWHETFDELTAQGKSPTGIKATIEYVTTPQTQQEVALDYGVSDVTIRNLQTAVVALGPIEHKRGAAHSSGEMSALQFCNYLSDAFGWEEGLHYSLSKNGYNDTQQPRLLKEGWRSLYEELLGDIDE